MIEGFDEITAAAHDKGVVSGSVCGLLPESAHAKPVDQTQHSLTDAERLRALHETELLEAPSPIALQLLCELTCTKLNTPVALVSLVTQREQVFAGASGLCEPWNSQRRTPLSHSFCQHVVTRAEPLVISDATRHPLVVDNKAITDLGVIAYLGVPLVTEGGKVLGSICAIDSNERHWTEGELDALTTLAATAMREISSHQERAKEKKRLEADLQQARKMEAIGTLASAIAHDFNNILMAYQSLTEMITFDPENIERVVECAKTILTTNERAKAIVQQLVSWTHHGSQETMPLNLSQTIRSARPLMRALIPSNVELQVRVAQHDLFVEASPESVTQILLNLIGNAEFAMRERGGKLAVVVESTEMKTDNGKVIPGLSLHVRDDGCGIPADLQHQVCTPFFTTKTGEGHSGMGLATVYETVRALNGRLEITSKENQGTNIQIQLPVLDGLSTHSVASEGDRHNHCTDARILLVDDDAVIANSMTEQLRMYGYVVECQTNSSAALERFNANPNGYDLLLTDLTMPGMCGDELMRAVREVRSELPVVLLTGFNYSAEGEASEVVSLRKPIAISDLVEKIEFALTSNALATE